MAVQALDHVNICTPDVAGTGAFFAEVLGMAVTASPGSSDLGRAAWIRDGAGRAIIHLASEDIIRESLGDAVQPSGSGRIHHVALICDDYDAVTARLDARGLPYRVREAQGRRVMFVSELNGILLELNFLATPE